MSSARARRDFTAGCALRLIGRTSALADGNTRLVDGSQRLVGGSKPVVEGSQRLVDGSQRLVEGGKRLVDGSKRLVEGNQPHMPISTRLADGSKPLAERDNCGIPFGAPSVLCCQPTGCSRSERACSLVRRGGVGGGLDRKPRLLPPPPRALSASPPGRGAERSEAERAWAASMRDEDE